jgi:hypothetical protein
VVTVVRAHGGEPKEDRLTAHKRTSDGDSDKGRERRKPMRVNEYTATNGGASRSTETPDRTQTRKRKRNALAGKPVKQQGTTHRVLSSTT